MGGEFRGMWAGNRHMDSVEDTGWINTLRMQKEKKEDVRLISERHKHNGEGGETKEVGGRLVLTQQRGKVECRPKHIYCI